jgi:prevent-host-death family protein
MSSDEVGIEDARKRLGDYVNAALIGGTTTVITRNGRPVARIAPLELDLHGRRGAVAEEDAHDEHNQLVERYIWGELALRGPARRERDPNEIATFRRRRSAEVVLDADDLSGVWTNMSEQEKMELMRRYEAAVTAALPDGVILVGDIVFGTPGTPEDKRPAIVHAAVDSIDVRAMIRDVINFSR